MPDENIYAKVISDRVEPCGVRLISVEARFHRFILPEVNTYRMISKNASSSRAIPSSKRIEEVRFNPAIPVNWGKNQRGMVADQEVSEAERQKALQEWLRAADLAALQAERLVSLGIHKQVASRILEPFLYQTMILTSTDFTNMFRQRIHPDAQPEFRELAIKIKEAIDSSEPIPVEYGEWTLPYIREEETYMDIELLKKISVARVARTSYGNQGKGEIEKDLELYERLYNANPPHYAPMEPIATPISPDKPTIGNFKNYRQLRHIVELEKGKI